ncbi:MAG: iron ABC transporter permease [Proteobacteria bacterium]|nr:MAG: iron ABC transporter permease [Pseudomonadota bacterium]PIE40377.1 MAG: iron ABC transporter permease [Gammaproteobacteria bacterium]
MNISYGERSFRAGILIWAMIGVVAYSVLPWVGLEYGLFDSTADEYYEALGWQKNLISLFVPALLLAFLPIGVLTLARNYQGWLITGLSSFLFLLIFFDFLRTGSSMGLGAGVVLLTLIALFSYGIARLGFLQGDTFISGAVVFIIFVIGVFIFFPVLTIFYKVMVSKDGGFAPMQFFDIMTSFGISRVVINTLVLAISVGIVTTLLGLLFALYSIRSTSPLRHLMRVFYILPIITPPFVVGMSLILLFGRAGILNDGLMYLFGTGGLFIPEGAEGIFQRSGYIYGFSGIFLAQVLSLTPISYMVIVGMLSSINPAMEEASLTMRADRWTTLKKVTLPLLAPGLANAFLLSVISSAADFGNPLVLGGEYDVLSTEIYFSIAGAQLDFAKAAALGILLLILSLTIFMIQKKYLSKKSYVTVTGIQTSANVTPLPVGLQKGLTVFVCFWLALIGILYASIFLGGFVKQWGADYTLTLAHHQSLWANGFSSGGWPSFTNSLLFSFIAAPITALLGILIAYVLTRKQFIGHGLIDFGTVLIFAVPGTVAGIAYIMAFNTAPIELTGTAIVLIITMAIRSMPVGIRGGMSALSQISTSLEEASLLQRAGTFKTLRSVLLPLMKSTIISSTAYSFIRSMTTVSAVIFLASAGTNVATTYILSRVESGDNGVAVAYGSVLILTMLVFTLLIQFVTGQSRVEKRT